MYYNVYEKYICRILTTNIKILSTCIMYYFKINENLFYLKIWLVGDDIWFSIYKI